MGVDADRAKSAEHYGKAADLGDATSQNQMGYFFEMGIGVEKDLARAFEWYQTRLRTTIC